MIKGWLGRWAEKRLILRLQKDQTALENNGFTINDKKLIVSLTSIESRLHLVDLTLNSLLSQSLKPTKIILWLSEDIKELPSNILHFIDRGVTVKQCSDVGPHTKLVPSLVAYPSEIIVTADDDTLYPQNWLRELVDAHIAQPTYIYCHRAHLIKFSEQNDIIPYRDWGWLAQGHHSPSHKLFATGVGGVLYPPRCLHKDATNVELFKQLSPKADDIWFKVMAILNGTKVSKINKHFREFPTTEGSQEASKLGPSNVGGGANDKQLKACLKHYGLSYNDFLE